MPMSTNISDLPGPQVDFESEMEKETRLPQIEQFEQLEEFNYNIKNDSDDIKLINEQPNAIKMDIKKVQKEQSPQTGFFDTLYNQFNEENLLILIILYLATIPLSNEYTQKLISPLHINNPFIITVIKCVLLLLIFIIIKLYILPNIKI